MAPELPLTGGCLCGGVRYEIDRPLGVAGYCHCTRCQRRTGTGASPQARVEPEPFSVRLGTFDSDPGVRPAYRQFVAYAASWEPLPEDGLARHRESSRG